MPASAISQMEHYPSYTYHDGILLMGAIRARDRAHQDLKERGTNALTSDAIAAVIMAAAAAEAFINELPGRIRSAISRQGKFTNQMVACADALDELETVRANTGAKYQVAAITLRGEKFPPGEQPFQDFDQLVRLRNALMHPKAVPDIRKLISDLARRGLTTDRRIPAEADEIGLTWLDRLQDPAIADWACLVAHKMMLAVLDIVATHTDELDTVHRWFNDKLKFPTTQSYR
jgi:hypothetical protein